ncbi:hypothetical protein QJQ45_005635 [Haematococcus lacustris]|nr:hypothetical protein QJQ45_005635 [Haematococcus lacustris]
MSSVEEEVAGSEPSSLSLITADLALLVANHLALDEKAIGRLGTVSKFWRTVCSDQRLWSSLSARRFALQLEVTMSPDHFEGWRFVQGMKARGNEGNKLEDLPLAEVAAAAAKQGALGFYTEGDVFHSLAHPDEWQHTSFHPQTGTYVQPTWTHLPKLLPAAPDLSPAGQGPPELQGWTFLPGLDLAQTRALPCLVKDFRSLADLAHHCLNKHEVVAFTTKGHVAELPAVQWCPTLEAWHGVYVRSSALAEGSLLAVPTWQQRFLHWASLRLPVVDQWVCWLDGKNLRQVLLDGSLAPEVALLRSVWWLALDAQWPAVAPGDYLLAWRVRWIERPFFSLEADLQLQGTRGPGEKATSHLPLISRQNMSRQAGQHASHGQAVQGLPLYRHFSVRELQEVARSAKGDGWVWLQVGQVQVPPGQSCTLYARLWNIVNDHKSGMVFDVVELKRVPASEEESEGTSQRERPCRVGFSEGEELHALTGTRQSGGERSVSTILYLIALQVRGRVTAHPRLPVLLCYTCLAVEGPFLLREL